MPRCYNPILDTVHETSGTSGNLKSFFLTWENWNRYAEKYARAFVSQNFTSGDRVVVCASYGIFSHVTAIPKMIITIPANALTYLSPSNQTLWYCPCLPNTLATPSTAT